MCKHLQCREFESIETFPGFARFLGENLDLKLKKPADRFMMLKKLVKWQKSRSQHCDFTKQFEMHEF